MVSFFCLAGDSYEKNNLGEVDYLFRCNIKLNILTKSNICKKILKKNNLVTYKNKILLKYL